MPPRPSRHHQDRPKNQDPPVITARREPSQSPQPAPGGRRKQALRTQNLKKGGCGQRDTATSLPETKICAAERHIGIAMAGCANQNHRRSSGLGCPPRYRASRQPNSSSPLLTSFLRAPSKATHESDTIGLAPRAPLWNQDDDGWERDSSSLRWTVDTPSRCIRTHTCDPPEASNTVAFPFRRRVGGPLRGAGRNPSMSLCFPSRGVDGSSPVNTVRTR